MRYARYVAAVLTLALLGGLIALLPSHADASNTSPDQASCDSGSTTYTWSGLGLARPVVASMTIAGQTVPDPTNPDVGEVGVVVCPTQDQARFVSVALYQHVAVNDNRQDLTGAMAPDGITPITADTEVSIILNDLGTNSSLYTFSLVHGVVSSWGTANLGTSTASVTITFKPARTPLGDGAAFVGCTATPPTCTATKSDQDILSGSLYMLFDQAGYGREWTGSYFGLVSAMGGFVSTEAQPDGSSGLVATLGAPHFLADGVTPNVGSLQAFLPTSVLSTILGVTGTVDTSTLSVVKTVAGSSVSTVPFSVTSVPGGVTVNVDNVTFSTPEYTIKSAADMPLDRLSGANRIATAIAVNQDAFPTAQSVSAMVVTTSADFPDGMAAGPLAALIDVPLLLNPKDTLDSTVAAEIQRVFDSVSDAADDVYIIGGTSALSTAVENSIKALDADIQVKRIAGADRIETAVGIAQQMDVLRGTGPTVALLANARNFPDALAGSAAASSTVVNAGHMPILLSNTASLSNEVAAYMSSVAGSLKTVDLLGGTAALSDTVKASVDAIIENANRLAGTNRYGTAVAIAEAFFAGANVPRTVGIASGLGFADALTGGRHSGLHNQPLLLVNSSVLPAETGTYLQWNAATVAGGNVYGGTTVVPDSVKQAAEAAY